VGVLVNWYWLLFLLAILAWVAVPILDHFERKAADRRAREWERTFRGERR
jgi:hypothetical protein